MFLYVPIISSISSHICTSKDCIFVAHCLLVLCNLTKYHFLFLSTASVTMPRLAQSSCQIFEVTDLPIMTATGHNEKPRPTHKFRKGQKSESFHFIFHFITSRNYGRAPWLRTRNCFPATYLIVYISQLSKPLIGNNTYNIKSS